MKNTFLLLLFINLYTIGISQVIEGTIFDKDNHSPINFASVYINGTFVGTHTDQNGRFALDITSYSSMPVTISALSYYSVSITDFASNTPIIVYLEPKTFELNEVVISADVSAMERERKRNMRLFKSEFLGTTAASVECEMINENDIAFASSAGNDTLKAFSSKPIIIDNKALGYKITYYLDRFECCKTNKFLLLRGNYLFEEYPATSQAITQKYERKRRNTYLGSRMHFFRSLWLNDLKASGFIIINKAGQELNYDSLVVMSDSLNNGFPLKYLNYREDFFIKHYPGSTITEVTMDKENVFFSRSGYFDPLGIKWSGDMAQQRVADLLPFDYTEEMDKSDDQSPVGISDIIEKVYLHTDRNYYYPGDDIWFKAYLIDAAERLLSDNSNNLHVELISPASEIIESRIIKLEGGLGNGDFALPSVIAAGSYRIRAYTNYMRNFGDELFFQKEVVIINLQDSTEQAAVKREYINDKILFTLYPEGGSLVDNVLSLVAFKATDALGKSCDVEGEIFSSEGESVTTFHSSHQGMGSFYLRPAHGLNYYAIVNNDNGDTVKADIPESFAGGVAMSIAQDNNDEIIVTVKTNSKTAPLALKNDLELIISARQKVLQTISFRIQALSNSLIIPVEDLPDGILMFTLSGVDDLPICERLFYIQKEEGVMMSVGSDRKTYDKRDSVSLRISFPNDYVMPQDAFLSLSASEKISGETDDEYSTTISSWFLLESDIRGPVESPSYYFDPSNKERISDLNLLLLTQGWRDFEWKYNEHYLPENGFSISGKLRKLFSDNPIETSNVNIGIFGSSNTFSTSVPADSAGNFRLDGIIFTGDARLIMSGKDKKGEPRGLILLDSLKYSPANVSYGQTRLLTLSEETRTALYMNNVIANNIRDAYTLTDTIVLEEIVINAPKQVEKDPQILKVNRDRSIYGVPDFELIVTPELEGLSNILEVIRGRVPGVMVDGNFPNIKVYIRGFSSFNASSQPIFVLDGSRVSIEDILAIPVNCVDRIDVLKGPVTATYGVSGANGVISVITRTGDRLASYQPVYHSVNVKIHGYDAARVFYSPQHLNEYDQAYKPDFRTTLFWEPDINMKTDTATSLKYFNSDHTATIQVIVEGITSTGIPLTAVTEYEVR